MFNLLESVAVVDSEVRRSLIARWSVLLAALKYIVLPASHDVYLAFSRYLCKIVCSLTLKRL